MKTAPVKKGFGTGTIALVLCILAIIIAYPSVLGKTDHFLLSLLGLQSVLSPLTSTLFIALLVVVLFLVSWILGKRFESTDVGAGLSKRLSIRLIAIYILVTIMGAFQK